MKKNKILYLGLILCLLYGYSSVNKINSEGNEWIDAENGEYLGGSFKERSD